MTVAVVEPKGKYLLVCEDRSKTAEELQQVAGWIADWYTESNSPLAVIGPGLALYRIDQYGQKSNEEEDQA